MADILVMKTKGKTAPKPDKGKPDKAKLVKGKYNTTTWNHFTGEDDRLFCGCLLYTSPSPRDRG